MRALDIVIKKRNGESLSEEEIAFLVRGYVDGSIPEYQISAFLMARLFQGNECPGDGVSHPDDDRIGVKRSTSAP